MSEDQPETAEVTAHRRRLAVLRERAALQGAHTDPATRIEIEDIERQLRALGAAVAAPAATGAEPWWATIAGQGRGDVIVGQIGANAHNVAVGKQIMQQVGAAAAADDSATVALHLRLAEAALAAATLDAAPRAMAEFQLGLLRAELLKEQSPSSTTLIHVGDWLLRQIPALGAPLRDLFTSPEGARLLARAGAEATAWAARSFAAG